jgi:hypothetical protein
VFFIFGWNKKSATRGAVVESRCHHCRNHVSWHHFKITDWLELFFIPLIPFRSEHFLACGICGDAVKLTGEESRGVESLFRMTAAERDEWREYLVERLEDHQLGDMSDTQKNWHRQQSD